MCTAPTADVTVPEHVNGLRSHYELTKPFSGKSLAGNYLASTFAQEHHDWHNADIFIQRVLTVDPENTRLQKRAMILAMGAGKYERALRLTQDPSHEEDAALTYLFLATRAFKEKNYTKAADYIQQMPEGSLSEFMMPLLHSWTQAGVGTFDVEQLNANTLHIYHRILIMHFLGKMVDVDPLLQQSMNARGLTLDDVERVADIYASIGKKDKAKELYQAVLADMPTHSYIKEKLNAIENGQDVPFFETVNSPEHGVAQALYDMALLLYRESSDESARVFAHMALYLNPDLTQSTMLLANIASRHERTEDAIAHYAVVPPGNKYFLEASRKAADLLENMEKDRKALDILQTLFETYRDVDALIQIGDIHRRNEDYDKAIKGYNTAEDVLGTIGPEHWHLHYLRGISYEQNKQWHKAEKDLQAALIFQPNHPLVLNYLGYSWADQGLNLEKSLQLIRKAAAEQSDDGYIIDSLGWVLYRMSRFEEAVPHLERAVELVPYDPIINDHLGDAYWQVGRKREARFQWLRAKNHTEDEKLLSTVQAKLENGMEALDPLNLPVIKEAHSQAPAQSETTQH